MNVIYINTHDSGRMLSPYGYSVPTPNLQEFSKESLLFRQAYCVGPTCSPSRAGLVTGMYPHSNGMLGLSQRGFGLKDYSWHLVNKVKENGYHTVLCGIQHEAGSYLDHSKGAAIIGYDEDITCDNRGIEQEDLVKWDYENAKKVVEWIKVNGKKEKFFMSYGLYATHRRYPKEIDASVDKRYVIPPYPSVDTEETREDHARYLTSAAWFDRCFGLVINTLKEEGLYEDTIILYTTDHGVAIPYSKCTLYDSGIGVALIMRVPGSKSNGEITDSLVSQVDIYPTLCDLLNIEKSERIQGKSFARFFSNSKEVHREEVFAEINFHTSYEPTRCVRTKRYKYLEYVDEYYLGINYSNIDESISKEILMDNGLKEQFKPRVALFDLYHDPGERRNLAGDEKYSDVLKDMENRLLEWQKETKDPLINGAIEMQRNWKVNKRECLNPSSKNEEDYDNLPRLE
jgi:arylsulfatase A-like enzyme